MSAKQRICLLSSNAIRFLKTDCKLKTGFCSQKPGLATPSATSTAFVIYVLSLLGKLSCAERESLLRELLEFRVATGFYRGAFGTPGDVTTWSTAQACLALEAMPGSEEWLSDAIKWLCGVQRREGGWDFLGKGDTPCRLEYCFYPLLAMKKLDTADEQVVVSLAAAKRYLVTTTPETLTGKLMRLFLLKRVYGECVPHAEIDAALTELRRNLENGWDGDKVLDSSGFHFYIHFYAPTFYLLVRDFVGPSDPLAVLLMNALLGAVVDDIGWAPRLEGAPFSWTTALGLLCLETWVADCEAADVDCDDVLRGVVHQASARRAVEHVQAPLRSSSAIGGPVAPTSWAR